MIVRPATLPDLIWIRMLYAQMLAEVAPTYPLYDAAGLEAFTSAMAARLGVDGGLVCYVAEDGPLVGGFLLGEILHRTIGHPKTFATAHWLYVVPQWRGQGVGRALSLAALAEYEGKGVEGVELGARIDDPQWAARGWIPVSITYALPFSQAILTVTKRPEAPNGDAAR